MTDRLAAVILAAGKGKRMKSDLPKVLHQIDGKPLIRHLLESVSSIPFENIVVVVGHKGELVIDELKDFRVDFIWQREQKGTGHAVLETEGALKDFEGTILVANGDVPFLSASSIMGLCRCHRDSRAAATCLSAEVDNPGGYGRIVRRGQSDILEKIIEEKDADEATRLIREINSGMFCFNSRLLFPTLHQIRDDNAQKEYYITDTIKILRQAGEKCAVWKVSNPLEVEGVNSVEQLKSLEVTIRNRKL